MNPTWPDNNGPLILAILLIGAALLYWKTP
jgi:hypothetical protein